MNIYDDVIRRRNPDATMDLVIPTFVVSNVAEGVLEENCRINSARQQTAWVSVSDSFPGVVALCGAGPSLADTWESIPKDAVIMACNSASGYLSAKGRVVDMQVIMDADASTLEEVDREARSHFFASTVAPALFDAVEGAILWHPDAPILYPIAEKFQRNFAYIGGGIFVGNYAACLAHTIGFRELHFHGFDHSFRNGEAYATKSYESSSGILTSVEVAGRTFQATFQMQKAAATLFKLSKLLIEAGSTIKVFGEGLLPTLLRSQPLDCD